MSEVFDPESFVNNQVDNANSTRTLPVPEGEYLGVIDKVKADTIGQNDLPVLRVYWKLDDSDGAIQAATGREESRVEQLIFLDLTDSGGLDMSEGKNVGLGRLRKAIGQNKPGQAWAPSMMEGQAAKVSINHQPDKEDPEIKYERIKRVDAA